MPLTFDPEIAAALAPMAEAGFAPPAVGDIAGRRAMWEPIIFGPPARAVGLVGPQVHEREAGGQTLASRRLVARR